MEYQVFITKANLNKIIYDHQIISYPININEEEYWDSTIHFFNQLDIKEILIWKEALKKGNIQDVFKKLKRKDSRAFVDPDSFPAYHYDINCKFLLRDFEGFRIPDHIREIDKIFNEIFDKGFNKIVKEDIQYLENYFKNYAELKKQGYFDKMHNNIYKQYMGSEFDYIKKFRDWIKPKLGLLKTNPDILFYRARMRFGDIGSKNQLIVNAPNSGVVNTTKKIEDLENQIRKLLKEADEFINASEENYKIISTNIKKTHLNNNDEEVKKIALKMNMPLEKIKETLRFFHINFKVKVIKEIKEYWIKKLNPNLSFSSDELDKIRFKKCNFCWDSEYIDNETLQDLDKDFGKKSSHKNSNAHKVLRKLNKTSDPLKIIRLNKVLREFNISLERVGEFLSSNGHEVKARPTTKITQVQYDLISNEFSK